MKECKVPLRIILQNFINNVESLESKHSDNDEIYEQEFQELKKLTESLKTHPSFLCSEGEKECNRRKNRYKDILPYDVTRVVLQSFPGIPGSDYVNANYIRGASGSRAYIASQGPLPNTVSDFWRMVVECDVQVIVMASNAAEGGKLKCECYWVEEGEEEKQFGNVTVSFIKSKQICPDFLVRTLKIKYLTDANIQEEKTICQFHYILWPDHGVPETVKPLLQMVRLIRDCQASETLPVLVHCSAGCGRTGTICAIDYVWGLLRTGKLTENLNLLDLVSDMRSQRIAMVQTREQYALLHHAVKELFRERLSLIDSHPYENISTDGNPITSSRPDVAKESDYEELLLCPPNQEYDDAILRRPFQSDISRQCGQHNNLAGLTSKREMIRRSSSANSLNIQNSKYLDNYCWSSPFEMDLSSKHIQNENKPTAELRHSYDPLCPVDQVVNKGSGCGKRSKSEKEAINVAQKMEFSKCRPPVRSPIKNESSNYLSRMSESDFASSSLSPPLPPKSRTPSPKSFEKVSPREIVKHSDLVRKPSIKKLKDFFEKTPPKEFIDCPNGKKLFRSASSVSFRPKFSIFSSHSGDETINIRSKECESILTKANKRPVQISRPICPPPPPPVSKPSPKYPSELHTAVNPPRRYTGDYGTIKQKYSMREERPSLPVKKSKSFRVARPPSNPIDLGGAKPHSEAPISSVSPLNERYHSLDRARGNLHLALTGNDKNKSIDDHDSDLARNAERSNIFVKYSSSKGRNVEIGRDYELLSEAPVGYHSKSSTLFTYQETDKMPPSTSRHKMFAANDILNNRVSSINAPQVSGYERLSFPHSLKFSNENNKTFSDPHNGRSRDQLSDKYLHNNNNNKPVTDRITDLKDGRDYVNSEVLSAYFDCDNAEDQNLFPAPAGFNEPLLPNYSKYNVINFKPNIPSRNNKEEISKQSEESSRSCSEFGEADSTVDEVFETINYELIDWKTMAKSKASSRNAQRDFETKPLDSQAARVFEDCQAYLQGNSSQLPQLMPKPQPGFSSDATKSTFNPDRKITDKISSVEDVKNKVLVPPHGLRNRERRNSYRQAVNTASTKFPKQQINNPKVHKYEQIWVEDTNNSPEIRSNAVPNSFVSDADSKAYNSTANIHKNILTVLDKALPDLSEEDLSSKDSGSSNSLHSKNSSKKGDKFDPIYANVAQGKHPPGYPTKSIPPFPQRLPPNMSQPLPPRKPVVNPRVKPQNLKSGPGRGNSVPPPVGSRKSSLNVAMNHNLQYARQNPTAGVIPDKPLHKGEGSNGKRFVTGEQSKKQERPKDIPKKKVAHSEPSTTSNAYKRTGIPEDSRPKVNSFTPDVVLCPRVDANSFDPTIEVSSTDTEDENSLNRKAASKLLRRIKAAGKLTAKNEDNTAKEEKQPKLPLPSSSPRALAKALVKFRAGSKTVAANFKSYINSKGQSLDGVYEPQVSSFTTDGTTKTGQSKFFHDAELYESNWRRDGSHLPPGTRENPVDVQGLPGVAKPQGSIPVDREPLASNPRQSYL